MALDRVPGGYNMSNFFEAPTINFKTTTLNGAIDDSVQTIAVNSATNLVAPGYIIIDRVNAAGTSTSFYIHNTLATVINTPVPLAGMRFVFKLEKTAGIISRTTSIDYLYWNKERT